ncbi:amidase [Amycolatopsis sulphurea]|uniref:Amidase n=1 Tax=Amycolatopsis sulphurea TaxID=76022 RepID=A0A2A9FKF9_9PSEU|nr:amidase [Amycolatopsis sulphurea]PFG51042.1 amidase [Amycolatopsis sulphurea]
MRLPVPIPTLDDLREHASTLGFDLSDAELEAYRALVEPNLEVYRALDEIEDEILPPQYPRSAARRPEAAENPYNAWAAKIEVRGAATGPLAGRTVVLKDNICLAGAPLLNGTRALEGYTPDSDATVATRVLEAGGRIVGKAHCEYLSGSGGSHTNAWGLVRNPHRPTHSAGGSSSGCAVLVATGEADMAVGADQGGSIRIPASFSGIVGMKPTHGLVPYTGIAPIDPTLDHAGPMTATVTDNARLLSVLAGADGLDPRQYAPTVGDYLSSIEEGVAGLRIGVVTEGFGLPESEADVDASVRAAAQKLQALGAVVADVSIPLHTTAATVWLPITAEGALRTICYSNGLGTSARGFYPVDLLDHLATWRATTSQMPPNVKMVLLLAEHMHARHHGRFYAKAQNLLRRATAAYDAALSRFDLLVMPTTPMKAPPIPAPDAPMELVVQQAYETHGNTAIFDATGHPALSMPCGMNDGLPIGLMMIGRHFDEPTIYRAARALERHLALGLAPESARP